MKLGGKRISLIVSIMAGVMFGMTAFQQFAQFGPAVQLVWTVLFAGFGAGCVWLIYLVFWGLKRLFGGPPADD